MKRNNNIRRIKREILRGERDIDYFNENPWPRFTNDDKLHLLKSCGPSCFLLSPPSNSLRNLDKYKFPICRPDSSHCHVDAYGILAARKRAFLTGKYPDLADDLTEFIDKFQLTKKSRNVPSVFPKSITKSLEGGLLFLDFSLFDNHLPSNILVWIEKVPDFSIQRKKYLFVFRVLLHDVPLHAALHKKKSMFSKSFSIPIHSFDSFKKIQILDILKLEH